MKILMIGDVVGSPGREMLRRELPKLRRSLHVSAVIVNGENAAGGSGITAPISRDLACAGADAITLGDHTWGQKEFLPLADTVDTIVRPANFPDGVPGKGWRIFNLAVGRFAVVNILGRIFMQGSIDCPFRTMDRILSEIPKDVPVFVDFHAEATSEKKTLGFYLDGRVAAIVGTHTHVQTSDAMVLPKGTAYLTDLGMTGPYISSIGRDLKPVTKKFITGLPARFDVAEGPCVLEGAVIDYDMAARRALSIETVRVVDPLKGG